MPMHKILKDNLKKIKKLCHTHNVKSLFIFGSSATGQMHDQSDIDLLISFNSMDHADYADNYFMVAEELEKILNKPVDLVTEGSLGNPYFIDSVNKTKVQIYG